jgi:hypothetical protein
MKNVEEGRRMDGRMEGRKEGRKHVKERNEGRKEGRKKRTKNYEQKEGRILREEERNKKRKE